MMADRNERALGSSVRHFDLECHAGVRAIRLPADPPHSLRMCPNKRDFLTSREVGNTKQYECKGCKKKRKKKRNSASFVQEGGSCLFLGCTENKHEIP
jgi:hypothetical protein